MTKLRRLVSSTPHSWQVVTISSTTDSHCRVTYHVMAWRRLGVGVGVQAC